MYRQDFLSMLNTKIPPDHYPSLDVKATSPAIIASLLDKSQDIRSATEEVLEQVLALHGTACFAPLVNNHKPAIRS